MPAFFPSPEEILALQQDAFRSKLHSDALGAPDVLMDAFGITAQIKASSPQYYGRELGMCWERLVRGAYSRRGQGFGPGLTTAQGSPCDFIFERYAFDTKYRLGSGDSGTLRKLADNAAWLAEQGYAPVMLFLREDSLPSALRRMSKAGWEVVSGRKSFERIKRQTGQDLLGFLQTSKGRWALG